MRECEKVTGEVRVVALQGRTYSSPNRDLQTGDKEKRETKRAGRGMTGQKKGAEEEQGKKRREAPSSKSKFLDDFGVNNRLAT
jgi:hypothetical protein